MNQVTTINILILIIFFLISLLFYLTVGTKIKSFMPLGLILGYKRQKEKERISTMELTILRHAAELEETVAKQFSAISDTIDKFQKYLSLNPDSAEEIYAWLTNYIRLPGDYEEFPKFPSDRLNITADYAGPLTAEPLVVVSNMIRKHTGHSTKCQGLNVNRNLDKYQLRILTSTETEFICEYDIATKKFSGLRVISFLNTGVAPSVEFSLIIPSLSARIVKESFFHLRMSKDDLFALDHLEPEKVNVIGYYVRSKDGSDVDVYSPDTFKTEAKIIEAIRGNNDKQINPLLLYNYFTLKRSFLESHLAGDLLEKTFIQRGISDIAKITEMWWAIPDLSK